MTMSSPIPSNSGAPANGAPASIPQLRFTQAFEQARDEIAAVSKDDLEQISLDIQSAVVTVLGCIPKITSHRPDVVAQLPQFEMRNLDRLETYALALGRAHVHYCAASSPPEPTQQLFDELSAIRETLVSDVSALAKRSILDGERLSKLNGTQGYKNVAFDVLTLCDMLRENWATVAGRTAVQMSELERAEHLAHRLATAVGLREQGPAVVAEAVLTRQRAFTLFLRAYEQVRRAITYLRWDDEDADRVAPSLYAQRGSRRRAEKDPAEPAEQPASPPPAPVAFAPNPQVAPAGMPGNSPFGNG